MKLLQEETESDEELRKLKEELKTKETSKGPYGKIYGELHEWNGVIARGDKIVIPKSLQPRAIAIAHEGHQGADKTLARLRETSFF